MTGCLKAFYINDETRMYILQFAMPTWWTSDYSALYNNTRASINVDCITDAGVLSLSNADREKICSEIHPIEHFFRWRTSEKYPTATLTITSVSQHVNNSYHVAGNLTIKGITQPVEFDAEVGGIPGDTLQASGKLVIDRTKYNMKFRSGNFFKDLGDTLIYNDFTLNIQLTAKAA